MSITTENKGQQIVELLDDSIIKVVTTTENKPAYDESIRSAKVRKMWTHRYQAKINILFVIRHPVPIVLMNRHCIFLPTHYVRFRSSDSRNAPRHIQLLYECL